MLHRAHYFLLVPKTYCEAAGDLKQKSGQKWSPEVSWAVISTLSLTVCCSLHLPTFVMVNNSMCLDTLKLPRLFSLFFFLGIDWDLGQIVLIS